MSKSLLNPDFGLKSCALCAQESPLRSSHIIPRFVFEWLKETSGTGHIRFAESVNLRVQDGTKPKLLCANCEQLFGQWEKIFAEQVFAPLHRGEGKRFSYGAWMLKFAVSVSWRVLTVYKLMDGLKDFPPTLIDAADVALSRWKEFLFDFKSNPGIFEQHMFTVDVLANTTFPGTSPNMSRYLARAIEMYVAHRGASAIVYAKLGRIVLFGFIEMPNANKWQGTKLRVKSGVFGSSEYHVPPSIGEFLIWRAQVMAERQRGISARQREIIEGAWEQNLERVLQSESFRAMQHDVALFGEAAFDPEDEE